MAFYKIVKVICSQGGYLLRNFVSPEITILSEVLNLYYKRHMVSIAKEASTGNTFANYPPHTFLSAKVHVEGEQTAIEVRGRNHIKLKYLRKCSIWKESLNGKVGYIRRINSVL